MHLNPSPALILIATLTAAAPTHAQSFAHPAVDLDRLVFDNAEYVKDGLIPITEWLGRSPKPAIPMACSIPSSIRRPAPILKASAAPEAMSTTPSTPST